MNYKERAEKLAGNTKLTKIGEVYIEETSGNIFILTEQGERILSPFDRPTVLRANNSWPNKSLMFD